MLLPIEAEMSENARVLAIDSRNPVAGVSAAEVKQRAEGEFLRTLGARSILSLGLGASNCVVPLPVKPVRLEPDALDGLGGHVLADLVGSSVELGSHA